MIHPNRCFMSIPKHEVSGKFCYDITQLQFNSFHLINHLFCIIKKAFIDCKSYPNK